MYAGLRSSPPLFFLTRFTQWTIPSRQRAVVVSIAIQGLSFNPARITLAPGTTIHWVNRDNVDHDVTSGESITGRKARSAARTKFPDGRFASGLFGQGKSFTVSFDKPGKYPYFCSIHPFMEEEVNVRQEGLPDNN